MLSASTGSVNSSRLLSRECAKSGSSTATPPGTSPTPTARRNGSEVKYASARASASSGAGSRGGVGGRYGTTAITAEVGSGPYRCGKRRPSGCGGNAGLEPHGSGQPGRVDDEQRQVAASGKSACGRDVDLVRRRQVHEADVRQRRRPHRAVVQRGAPLRGLDQVEEDVGRHSAILPSASPTRRGDPWTRT